jgi:hypothetical protein
VVQPKMKRLKPDREVILVILKQARTKAVDGLG